MPFKTEPPLYSVWRSMRSRCHYRGNRQWADYGGRGIAICERWQTYANFEADMSPRPPGLTLERIDNDGSYSPENCRWATRKEQQRNQRVTRRVIIDGKTYLAADLAERSGLKTDTIIERAQQGLSLAEVLAPERRVYTAGLALGGAANGRRMRAKTHCAKGHAFTPENTYTTAEGWRSCRECHRQKAARQRAAR